MRSDLLAQVLGQADDFRTGEAFGDDEDSIGDVSDAFDDVADAGVAMSAVLLFDAE